MNSSHALGFRPALSERKKPFLKILFGDHLEYAFVTGVWLVCFVSYFIQSDCSDGSLELFGSAVLFSTFMAVLAWLAREFLEL